MFFSTTIVTVTEQSEEYSAVYLKHSVEIAQTYRGQRKVRSIWETYSLNFFEWLGNYSSTDESLQCLVSCLTWKVSSCLKKFQLEIRILWRKKKEEKKSSWSTKQTNKKPNHQTTEMRIYKHLLSAVTAAIPSLHCSFIRCFSAIQHRDEKDPGEQNLPTKHLLFWARFTAMTSGMQGIAEHRVGYTQLKQVG